VLHLKTIKRLARPRPLRAALGTPDDRIVFVLGSPRSGTTFLAESIGSVPGFVDLSEVAAVKAAVPELARMPAGEAADRLRRTLGVTRAVGLVRGLRGVEQTPETAFIAPALVQAFPQGRLVHMLRDGRDVVCSLLGRGWLREERVGKDDAGIAHGAYARFWVEPERRDEFTRAGDARRAAWAWRSYVTAARSAEGELLEIRYETMAAAPTEVARQLANYVDIPVEPLSAALAETHDAAIGRYRRDLTGELLAEVEAEAGDLLRELGYRGDTPAR
jgi:hypothetical protein